MSVKTRQLRGVPPYILEMTKSFVSFVKLLGPKRRPSMGVRRALIWHMQHRDYVRQICGLVEWYMYRTKKNWATLYDNGVRWIPQVEGWVEENRTSVSAVRLIQDRGVDRRTM